MRIIGALAAIAIAIGQTQQPAEPQQLPPFRTGANIVRVDATVVDRRGNPVTALTADDFTVFEDGVPQRIQSFQFVGASGRPAAGDEASLAIRSPEHAAAEAARDDVRVFLIFWDDYHIGPVFTADAARRMLQQFVLTELGPTDLVGLMDPLTQLDDIRFTRDRRAMADTIHKLEGRLGKYMPPRNAAEEEHLHMPREIERIRAQITASALEGAAIHLGALREGRKSIILVSEFLPIDAAGIRALTDAANANNTAIHTLDARGLAASQPMMFRPPASDMLRVLSDNTGGRAILGTNDPMSGLRKVVDQASAVYLLGYSSSRNPLDGRFHRIEVRVHQPGLDVQARKGYWAPNASDLQRARTEATSGAPPEISATLAALASSRDDARMLDVWVGASRRDTGGAEVTVAWSPRTVQGRADLPVQATVTATGRDGRQYFTGVIPGQHVSFSAPAGPLRVQVAALDNEGAVIDSAVRQITVPAYGASLALSVPVVVRVRNPAEARVLLANPDAPPFAGREFARSDRLLVRFAVYGDALGSAAVTVRLMNGRGAALVSLPAERFAPHEHTYQIDLPLSGVVRGDYLIAIDVSRDQDHAQALVPLRVVR